MAPGRSAREGLAQASHQYSGRVCCWTVKRAGSTSTCWTTRASPPLRRKGPPQHGQASRVWTKKRSTRSAGKGTRSCLGCPGWPPGLRLSSPGGGGGGGGLTMSEEGGLDEVEESL